MTATDGKQLTIRPGDSGHDDDAPPPTTTSRVVGMVAVALLLASFGVWVYAYSGRADRPAPDLLDDPAFAAAAEEACALALDDVAAMPGALDAADEVQRAAQIGLSTDRFDQLVAELDGLVGGSDHDVEIQRGWIADWRVILGDRRTYAQALAADPDAQFYLTDTGVAERLDKRVTRMANTNSMPSCVAPTDVG